LGRIWFLPDVALSLEVVLEKELVLESLDGFGVEALLSHLHPEQALLEQGAAVHIVVRRPRHHRQLPVRAPVAHQHPLVVNIRLFK